MNSPLGSILHGAHSCWCVRCNQYPKRGGCYANVRRATRRLSHKKRKNSIRVFIFDGFSVVGFCIIGQSESRRASYVDLYGIVFGMDVRISDSIPPTNFHCVAILRDRLRSSRIMKGRLL